MKKVIKQVPQHLIFVDRNIQRDALSSHLKYLTGFWDEDAAGIIILSERSNGEFFVIDGQHRVLAKKDDPDYEFTALVFQGLNREEEARLFNLYNDKRKNVRPFDRYRAYLVSGAEPYVTVDKVLHDHGLKASRNTSDNTVSAIQSVLGIVQTWDADVLDTTLSVVEEAWGRDGDTWNGAVMYAVGILIGKYRAESDRLAGAIKTKAPRMWIAKAKNTGGGQGASYALVKEFGDQYNKRLGANRRLQITDRKANKS